MEYGDGLLELLLINKMMLDAISLIIENQFSLIIFFIKNIFIMLMVLSQIE